MELKVNRKMEKPKCCGGIEVMEVMEVMGVMRVM